VTVPSRAREGNGSLRGGGKDWAGGSGTSSHGTRGEEEWKLLGDKCGEPRGGSRGGGGELGGKVGTVSSVDASGSGGKRGREKKEGGKRKKKHLKRRWAGS